MVGINLLSLPRVYLAREPPPVSRAPYAISHASYADHAMQATTMRVAYQPHQQKKKTSHVARMYRDEENVRRSGVGRAAGIRLPQTTLLFSRSASLRTEPLCAWSEDRRQTATGCHTSWAGVDAHYRAGSWRKRQRGGVRYSIAECALVQKLMGVAKHFRLPLFSCTVAICCPQMIVATGDQKGSPLK